MAQKKYTKLKLKKFKKAIEEKMIDINGEMNGIRDSLENTAKGNASLAQDSVYSVHMADAGTDSYEREKSFHLMNRETDYFHHLQLALERIDADEFGVCMVCGELIPEERMVEVLNATKCVDCKEKEKLNLS